MINIRVTYIASGLRRSGTIHTPLRHLENALPWLRTHYPHIRFVWKDCEAFTSRQV
jgi:hypothetical protein